MHRRLGFIMSVCFKGKLKDIYNFKENLVREPVIESLETTSEVITKHTSIPEHYPSIRQAEVLTVKISASI